MWSLINLSHYASMLLQYSRGCPFDCEFCDITTLFGRVPRVKTPEQMIGEFQSLFNTGYRGGLFLVDDNFYGNKLHVKKMLQLLIPWQKEHNYPFQLLTEVSINLADDDEMLNLMREANFYNVFVGIESPNVATLVSFGKVQNLGRSLVDSIRKIQNHGLQVMGGFIVGGDDDNPHTIFAQQLNFIQEAGIPVAMVGKLIALRMTHLWHRMKKEGRLLREDVSTNTDPTNFSTVMGNDVLERGYRELLTTLFSSKNYYERLHTLLEHYRPSFKSKTTVADIFAFLHSIWRIGIFSRDNFRYWHLLIKAWFKNRRAVSVLVTDAIYLLHFRKEARAVCRAK
ncbi:MAG: DUF4070 domain-containing protein [Patescibacteria group bacterium]